MPTILLIKGWRLFFYSNENNEPIHIHCRKANSECKFWIEEDNYNLSLAYSFNCNQRDLRDLKKIIYNNFDYIVTEWYNYMEVSDE